MKSYVFYSNLTFPHSYDSCENLQKYSKTYIFNSCEILQKSRISLVSYSFPSHHFTAITMKSYKKYANITDINSWEILQKIRSKIHRKCISLTSPRKCISLTSPRKYTENASRTRFHENTPKVHLTHAATKIHRKYSSLTLPRKYISRTPPRKYTEGASHARPTTRFHENTSKMHITHSIRKLNTNIQCKDGYRQT